MGESADGDGNIIQLIINDLKASAPVWEDFGSKSGKLHTALRTTISAADAFLEAFQRVADVANSSRGCSRDMGTSLTKMVIRHRSIYSKLKELTGVMCDSLIFPLQDKLDEWKKTTIQLDKDHAKDYKKAKQDMKKAGTEMVKWQKKVKKGKSEHQDRLAESVKLASAQYLSFEDQEKQYLRLVLLEERARYCNLAGCFRPVVEQEISILQEMNNLESLLDDINKQTMNPSTLPIAGEDMLMSMKLSENPYMDDITPPDSPSNSLPRHLPVTVPIQLPTSPYHRKDPPRTPPPPPPTETDLYYNAFNRCHSFSVRHSATRGKAPPIVAPSSSPKKGPALCLRTSSFSMSSTSSHSSMSSLGSTGSPSTESLPHPPPPPPAILSPQGSIDSEPLPPPPFPGAVQALPPHPGDRTSWTTSDSGCYSSSSGERSPSASTVQVYCPQASAEHPSSDPNHHYATPYAIPVSRPRCMSESASHYQAGGHLKMKNAYPSPGNGEVPPGRLNYNDAGYLTTNQHRACCEHAKENSGGYVPQRGIKAQQQFTRSQSISGRPTQAQAYQLAAMASHAARSRSAPMPPARKSSVAAVTPEDNYNDADSEAPSELQLQIQRQKKAMQAKARERISSSMSEDR